MKAEFLGAVLILAIAVAAGFGWCMNIVKLMRCDFEPSYKAEVLRTTGVVFPPFGAVIGYMEIGQ